VGRHRLPLDQELRALSARMRALADGSGGVITAAQARPLGAGQDAIRRLISRGEWVRARRGVYRDLRLTLPEELDRAHHQRCAALLAALAAPAVISHTSAARLLNLPLPPGGGGARAHVARRPPAATNDPLLGDVHVTDYQDADVLEIWGVHVLAGARLVLDCCDSMPADSALAVADAMLFRRLTTTDGLHAELRRRQGRPGSAIAAMVVERADPGGRSWFESMSRWWLLEAGLPRPVLQQEFTDATRRVETDLWFPAFHTVGEADGAGKYDEPGSLFAEKQREDWLRDTQQVEMVRWIPREMRSDAGRAGVVARFVRAFRRRS
jgi:Transcriptional regulator, AbiEi antitoxin